MLSQLALVAFREQVWPNYIGALQFDTCGSNCELRLLQKSAVLSGDCIHILALAKLFFERGRLLHAVVYLLLRQGRFQNPNRVLTDNQSWSRARSHCKTCVALSIDFDLAENVDLVALLLTLLSCSFLTRCLLLPIAIGCERNDCSRLRVAHRGIE